MIRRSFSIFRAGQCLIRLRRLKGCANVQSRHGEKQKEHDYPNTHHGSSPEKQPDRSDVASLADGIETPMVVCTSLWSVQRPAGEEQAAWPGNLTSACRLSGNAPGAAVASTERLSVVSGSRAVGRPIGPKKR